MSFSTKTYKLSLFISCISDYPFRSLNLNVDLRYTLKSMRNIGAYIISNYLRDNKNSQGTLLNRDYSLNPSIVYVCKDPVKMDHFQIDPNTYRNMFYCLLDLFYRGGYDTEQRKNWLKMGDRIPVNGACILAMAGKDCVAIAADKRLGLKMETISTNFQRVFQMNDRILLGLAGFATDIMTVHEKLRFNVNLLELREEREIDPIRFKNLVASTLYEKRFGSYYVQPVIAALLPETNEPFLATSDSIGAFATPKDFAVAGTCEESLYGVCEALWKPDLNADQLFEVISKCFIAAVERDAVSGWGGIVYLMTKDQIITKEIKTRMD